MIPRWAVGVEANITIFNGLAKENKLRAAKAVANGVTTKVENAKNNIRLIVENEYYNVINALDNITTTESSIRLADSYFQSAQDGFKAGVTTSTELMDAEVNRSTSRLLYLNAVYEYCISLARLLEASSLSHTLSNYRENGIKPEYIIKSK
jgi:outer membrane protein TolC